MNRRTSLLTLSALALALVPRLAQAQPAEPVAEVPVVTEVTERPDGVTVDWTVPEALAAEAVLYEVTATIDSEDEDVDGDLAGHSIVAADVRSTSLAGLDADDDYDVQVQPITPAGRSQASVPVAAAADAEGPAATVADAPADVVVESGSGTVGVDRGKVRVSWAPAADNGAPVVAYSVAAFAKDNGAIVAFRSVGSDARSAVLTGLGHGQSLEVWVFAWTAQGMGDVAKVDTDTGDGESLAGGPVVPWAAAWDLDTLTVVTWGAATEHQEPVTGYDVIVLIDGTFAGWHQTGPEARQLALAPIPEGKTVKVYVFAHGATTLGAIGDPITFAAPIDVVVEAPEETTTTTEPTTPTTVEDTTPTTVEDTTPTTVEDTTPTTVEDDNTPPVDDGGTLPEPIIPDTTLPVG